MKRRIFPIMLITALALVWSTAALGAVAKPVKAGASGVVRIPIADLSPLARYYEFSDGATAIRFFAVLGADKKPRVALDACEVCGGRLGYEQRGTDIQCRVCGRVFRIDEIGTKNRASGCWPSYLPYSVKGPNIMIKAADLEKGRALFQ
jgi:uncharacterized membrane protein